MAHAASRVLVPVGTSLALHAALALGMLVFAVRPRPVPQTPLEIQVVDAPRAKAPEPSAPPPPIPVPRKLARAPRKQQELPPTPTPLPPTNEPPPPTSEAPRNTPQPVVVTGITMESTSQGGGFAVGAGNTLQGAPERTPPAPVSELPRPLNREALNLRRYYPAQAKRSGFEGDVVLRLLIDADGSIAKVDIVSDPGQGLGPAAAQAVRELRFSPAKLNGVAVATTVPFTIHFTLD